jgi:hypothetical protein
VLAWPLRAAALASALSAAGADSRAPALAATAVIAALTLGWAGALFHLLLQGLDLPILAATPAWLAALVLWPLVYPSRPDKARPCPRGAVILLSLVLATWMRFDDPWTARHPRAVEPVYVVDPAARRAWRASLLAPDPWTRAVLGADGGRPMRLDLPFLPRPVAAAPALAPGSIPPAPNVTRAVAPDGQLVLTATPHPGAAELWLAVRAPEPITGALANGRPAGLLASAGGWARVIWTGPTPLVLKLRLRDPARAEVATGELFDRWTAATPLPSPPRTDQPWSVAGSTLVVGRPIGQVFRADPTTPR